MSRLWLGFGGELGEMQVLRLRAPHRARGTLLRMTISGWEVLGLVLVLVGVAGAQGDKARVVSRAQYAAELRQMSGLVKACRGSAAACDVKAVPADEKVQAEGQEPQFFVRWDWLSSAVRKGSGVQEPVDKDAQFDFGPKEDRNELLDRASNRLKDDLNELQGAEQAADQAAAKSKVDEVLARKEFGQVQETKWWQLVMAKISARVEEWWASMTGVVPWAPWMGLAFEWGLLGAAAVGLIVWALRLGKQQRVSFAAERAPAQAWQAESDDWAARAKAEAAKGEWREAVHCLYWSAIVMLEGQRLWRQNRARTPREYVGLLEPGSARRKVLGGLTTVFERIWYGIRPATGEDYEKASRLLEELRVG